MKTDFKIWLPTRLALRIQLLYSDHSTGRIKWGSMSRLAEISIHKALQDASKNIEPLEGFSMDQQTEFTDEQWRELTRKAAADELDEATLKRLIEIKREGRKTLVGQKTKAEKATVTPISMDDLL